MNEVMKTIRERRSIRKFRAAALPKEIVEQVVRAGLDAPSARNRQPWHLCVVVGKERIAPITAELKAAVGRMPDNPYKAFVGNPAYTVNYHAPVFIIVSADPEVSDLAMADCALVLQNMFLAARTFGVGSCWINQLGSACADQGFRALLDSLGVPGRNYIYGCAALGYPEEDWPNAPERKADTVTWVE